MNADRLKRYEKMTVLIIETLEMCSMFYEEISDEAADSPDFQQAKNELLQAVESFETVVENLRGTETL